MLRNRHHHQKGQQRVSHILMALCALFAAAVLFTNYGTMLFAAPFATVALDGPTIADSDGGLSVVVDTESHRALILNRKGALTGVVDCAKADTPIDAITDACVSDETVYLSGVRFEPDSDEIMQERVVTYNARGYRKAIVYERAGSKSTNPYIVSLSASPEGVIVAHEMSADGSASAEPSALLEQQGQAGGSKGGIVAFELLSADETHKLYKLQTSGVALQDAGFSTGEDRRCAVLNANGALGIGGFDGDMQVHTEYVFMSIDMDDAGDVYACDDTTGSICVIPAGSTESRELVAGEGYSCVHENEGVLSLCDITSNKVTFCSSSGEVLSEFGAVQPSRSFSARMVLVWASIIYLLAVALTHAGRRVRRLLREGAAETVGTMLLAAAVVIGIAAVIGGLSYASYQASLDQRAREIDMCADYLGSVAGELSAGMEKVGDRSALRGTEAELASAVQGIYSAIGPAIDLCDAARGNGIGLYCNLYGKDDQGIFYLDGSANEYVMGTASQFWDSGKLEAAFEGVDTKAQGLLQGRTLRDATLCRLVQIPTQDGQGVAGVIEIGSKLGSFELSLADNLAQHALALLALVLVVYLTYCELRACGRCLLLYQQRLRDDDVDAVALLTRPFSLAVTMLSSIDSVMTVLIARELLKRSGMDASSTLLALPAVMLGIGLIIGQCLYSLAGTRVGLRRLMMGGATAMLVCACLAGAIVAFGNFWQYCAIKLALAIWFGMMNTMGYSLPFLAQDDQIRGIASGSVKRTATSAAALGTVLGGYAAQALGNGWVYALMAAACLPIILLAFNLLPRDMRPPHEGSRVGSRHMLDFVRKPTTLAIALLVVLPATVASGYASFLFPLYSTDLGLPKSAINNIVVLGQLVVYSCIGWIEYLEARFGQWRTSSMAIALLGVVFLLFAVNTTIAWSVAVISIVGLLCKTTDGWKGMWLSTAGHSGIPAGRATGSMFATYSLMLVVQPFILSTLLGAASSVAVIVIGLLCMSCAALFVLLTRRSALAARAE